MLCSRCQSANDSAARFCRGCSAALSGAPLPDWQAVATPQPEPSSSVGRALLIGADPACDVVVDDPGVSSWHAALWQRRGAWYVADLGSRNGTYVDGIRVERSSPVRSSSVLQVGSATWSIADLAEPYFRAPPSWLMGRDPDDDIFRDAPVISRHHLLLRRVGAWVLVVDLASSNGVSIDRPDNRIDRVGYAGPGGAVFAGSFRLSLAQTPLGSHSEQPTPAPPYQLKANQDRPTVIGRAPGCDLRIDAPQVSARHARLVPSGPDAFQVEDLGSTNGTFVNGRRVLSDGARVRAGDTLSLGSYALEVQPGCALRAVRGLRLDAIGVQRVVADRATGDPRTLLHDMSIAIYPGELVALMGPAGAGKSTLLMAMNGYERPTSGRVLLNGDDLYVHYDRFRTAIGYMPQDDIIPRELTVAESLFFTARLRLPPDTTDGEIHRRIDRVLRDVSMLAQRDLVIGSVEDKVLSGGQRKRVNLAQELITDPMLLFLDEPTSGLSSRDAAEVIDVLRRLADQGRTVIVTIHQPSQEVFARMDHVVLLTKGGRLAYFGPTDPGAYAFFACEPPTPEKVMDNLESRTPVAWEGTYRASDVARTYVNQRLGQAHAPDVTEDILSELGRPPSAGPQFRTLARRYALTKWRDRTNGIITALQAPVVAVLLGGLFHDANVEFERRAVPIFFAIIAAIFFGCFNASREIVRERALFRRERKVNLGIAPYLLSKFAVLALIGVGQAGILTLALSAWIGVDSDPLALWALLALTEIVATGMGLLLSTLVRSPEAAMALVPIVLIPQIVLAGFLVAMNEDGKGYVAPAAALMVSRWATQSLFEMERRGLCKAEGVVLPDEADAPAPEPETARARSENLAEDGNQSADACCAKPRALADFVECQSRAADDETLELISPHDCMERKGYTYEAFVDTLHCLDDKRVANSAAWTHATLASKGHPINDLRTPLLSLTGFLVVFLGVSGAVLRRRS